MKCPNCGTEGNFEWATLCRCCNHPIGDMNSSTDADRSISSATDKIRVQIEKEDPIVIQDEEKIEFTSGDPMDYVMGNKNPENEGEPGDNIKPMSMESELTLYRDENVKLTMSDTGKSARFTVATSKDDIEHIDVSESVSELIENEKSSAQVLNAEDHSSAEAEAHKPPAENAESPSNSENAEASTTAIAPVEQTPDSVEGSQEKISINPDITPIDSSLVHLKQSPKVIYLSGKNLRLTGGTKVIQGDEITINDKTFVVKAKPGRGMLFYAAIGAVAVVLFISLLIFGSGPAQGDGQLVGTIINPASGKTIAGLPVNIAELNKQVVTNQAGFFTFENIPTGIYTLNFKASDNTPLQERVTILKNTITTVALKEAPAESAAPPPPAMANATKPPAESNNESQPKTAGQGLLKLTIVPNNASAYIDGKPIGIGSHAYKLSPGDYTLTVSKTGYAEKSQGITIDPDRALSVKVTLAEASQATSSGKSASDLAYEQETAGNYNEALRYYDLAMQHDPHDATAALGKARCYRAEQMTDNAMAAYLLAAHLAADKNDINSQIAAFTGVIEMKPNTYTAYSSRGDLLYNQGQYNKAADDFSKVIELDNRNLTAYYKLGNSYYNSKEYQAAVKTFLAAQELNFADPKAEAYLAKTYLAMGDKKNSKKAYERFKELATYPTRLEFKRDPEWQNVLNALGVEY
jgi:tetratricopeptide (TPR) repeat protein